MNSLWAATQVASEDTANQTSERTGSGAILNASGAVVGEVAIVRRGGLAFCPELRFALLAAYLASSSAAGSASLPVAAAGVSSSAGISSAGASSWP